MRRPLGGRRRNHWTLVSMLMTPDNKPTLEELFHAARGQASAEDRRAYLDSVCAQDPDLRQRVEALLGADAGTQDFLEHPLVEPATVLGAAPGQRVGPYKLLQQIGEGGMGVVFMAEQEHPVRRKVALKIIKLGMDTKQVIARFEAERQALALMEHSNIARVLDAGATAEGRPFFVMELVRGVAIDEYCDTHQLTTDERLGLFMDTCRAVQHAHQKGIIHRDIKPGNVLVTSHDGTPVVKIIDFGVAKATNQKLTEMTLFTEFKQFIGTPEYMSPEQAEMSGLDVDTRTDIYSLGVLLYRLLTDSTPFDAKTLRAAEYGEMTRMIREDEPPTPSTRISKLGVDLDDFARNRSSEPGAVVKLLRGDLDWIVMKAISKDRTRRYDSASALADDVARHLRDEPVLASPPSTLYRAGKMLRRNRTLALATMLAALGLLAGFGLALSGYFAARAEVERSNKISASLTRMLSVAGTPDAQQEDVAEVLATAREVFGEDHVTVAATLTAMAGQLRNAGNPAGAQELYLEALATYRAAYGDGHRTVGQTLASLGGIQRLVGENVAAEQSLRESLRIADLQPGPPSLASCTARRELAQILEESGRPEEAEQLLREILAILRAAHSGQNFEIVTVLEALVQVSLIMPGQADLVPIFDELVDAVDDAFPPDHSVRGFARFGRAMHLYQHQRLDEAKPALEETLAALEAMDSPPPMYLFMTLDALFQLTRNRTDSEGHWAGGDYLMRFFEVSPALWGPDEPMLQQSLKYAVGRYFDDGRMSDALYCARGFLAFANDFDDHEQQLSDAQQVGNLIHAIVYLEAPLTADLEQSLEVLALFPTEPEWQLRVEILRTALTFRLGRAGNPRADLDLIRGAIDPDDGPTLDLLSDIEELVEAGG